MLLLISSFSAFYWFESANAGHRNRYDIPVFVSPSLSGIYSLVPGVVAWIAYLIHFARLLALGLITMSLFRLSPGKKRVGLAFMHSSKGTAFFKKASPAVQKKFSSYDQARSRKLMVKRGLI